ncbi:hypothetical protein BT69DRAFT_1287632 [Atractiella rhizophila]|nr:hypothetical protein BT69DRAFT_1287632 [Atractiella rhizophila]
MPRSDLGRSKSGKSGAEESISEESEVVFVPRKDKGKAKALDQDAVDGFSFENENPNPNSLQALVREEEVHTDHSAFTSPDASPAVGATVPLPISTKPTPVLPTTNSNGNVTTVPSPTSLPKLQTALPVPASAPASAISPSVSIRRLPPEPNAPSKVSTPIQPSPMRALPNPNGPSTAQVYERALSPAISSFSHTSSSQPYPLAHDDAPSPPSRMPSLLSQYQHSHSHSQSQSLSHSHSRASSTTGSRRMLPSPPPMPSTTPFSTSSHGSSYGNGGGHSTSLSQSFSAFSPSPLSNGAVGGGNGFVRTDLARDDYDPRMRDNLMSSPVYPRPVQGRGVAPEVQDY